MGISVNTIKKGLSFVLKSAQNEIPKAKLSVFESFGTKSGAKLENAFAHKTPLKAEVPNVTNPFAPSAESAEKSLHTASILTQKAQSRLSYLEKSLEKLSSDKDKKTLFEIIERFKQNPELLNTLPLERLFLRNLDYISKNPKRWLPEFSKLPFDKIKNNYVANDYFRKVTWDFSNAVYSKDMQIIRLGKDGVFGNLRILDLSDFIKGGKIDAESFGKFMSNLKSMDNVEDKVLLSLQKIAKNFDKPEEIALKYPKTTNLLFSNYHGNYTTLPEMGIKEFENTEKYIQSNHDFIDFKSIPNFDVLIKRANAHRAFSVVKFGKYSKPVQEKVLDKFVVLKNKDFIKTMESIMFRVEDEKLALELATDNKLFTKFADNYTVKIPTILGKQLNYTDDLCFNLALMKTIRPQEFDALKNTQGFKRIAAGVLDSNVLMGMKYDSGNEFFGDIFSKLERMAKSTDAYRSLDEKTKKILLQIIEKNPTNSTNILRNIEKAKDKELMSKVLSIVNNAQKRTVKDSIKRVNDGYYNYPGELQSSLRTLNDFIAITAENPEAVRAALKFKGYAHAQANLAKKFASNNLPENISQFMLKNSDKMSAYQAVFLADSYKRINNPAYFKKLISDVEKEKINISQMNTLLRRTNDNSIGYITGEISTYKPYDVEKISKYASIMSDYPQLKGAATHKYKEFIKNIDEVFSEVTEKCYGSDWVGFKKVLDLKLENPQKYAKLKDSGVFDLIKSEKLSVDVLRKITHNTDFSADFYKDLKLLKEGKSIVPSFESGTSLEQAFKESQTGDAVEIGNKMYINDGKELVEWQMTKEKFLELFPPVERFASVQKALGDCFLVSSLNSCMRNPNARAELYKSFKLDGDDIKVTIKAYEDFKGTTVFKNGVIELDDEALHLSGCKGLQMLEQSYAKTSVRDLSHDFTDGSESKFITGDLDKMHPQKYMRRIYGGYSAEATGELLGIEYKQVNGTFNPIKMGKESVLIPQRFKNSFEGLLEKYANNDDYILQFGTVTKDGFPAESALLNEYNLVSRHAYAISGYDPQTKIVKIVNPHNASLDCEIPFETLKQYLCSMYLTKLT